MIKIEVCLDSEHVREFCIRHDYYTCGSWVAYENLLYNVCGEYNVWYDTSSEEFDEKIKEIAEDIFYHSPDSPEFASKDAMMTAIISGLIRENMCVCVRQ